MFFYSPPKTSETAQNVEFYFGKDFPWFLTKKTFFLEKAFFSNIWSCFIAEK